MVIEVLNIGLERPTIIPPTIIITNGIYDDVIIGVSTGDGGRVFSSQETIHFSSCNSGFYCRGYQSGEGERGGYWYQDSIHCYSHNLVSSVYGDVRGVYRYQNIISPSHNPVGRDKLLGLSFASCPVEKKSMVMRDVDIGLRSETLPPITQVGVVDCCAALLLHVLLTKVFMVIIGVI